jgi:hypothetical protein
MGDADLDDDVSTSESSYVSTSDSDERRERKYRERMAKTKAKLDWDIQNLRDKDEKINIANDKLRLDIAELSNASVDLRRVNTELQQEYRRCQTAHTERKAKISLLHERDMKKLQSQVVSSRVQDRKVALNAERDKAAYEKEKNKADAEYAVIQEEIESRQAEHDRLKPLYIKMYGKKAYNKMWDGIKEKYPLPTPPPREKRVSRDDPRLKEKRARAEQERAAADQAQSASDSRQSTPLGKASAAGKKARPDRNSEEAGQLAYAQMSAAAEEGDEKPLDANKRRRSVAKPTTPTKDRRKGYASSAQPERPQRDRAASSQDPMHQGVDEVEWELRNRADSEEIKRSGLLGQGHKL